MTTEHTKIVFPLDVDEDGFPPIGSESLNARREGTRFILDNTPFFVPGVALGDVVEAVPAPSGSGKYDFVRVVTPSTNKALSIIFLEFGIKDAVCDELRARGCFCEWGTFGRGGTLLMLAVSVPDSCSYPSIADFLDRYERDDRLSYAELAV
ncbi:MAG: DUF4265 domain-containing protein [Myxococcota bacterium]